MRAVRRVVGDKTYFLVTDLEPEALDGVQAMMYPSYGDGYGRSSANDTPNLDRSFANFERVIEEAVLQAGRTRPVPWDRALIEFMEIVDGQAIDWWLTGSAALAARGVDVVPGDVDLVVANADAVRLGTLLLDYVYEPVTPVDDWICNWFGRAFLHARVERVGGVNSTIDSGGISDAGPTAGRMLQTITWRSMQVRVPPIDLQLDVSRRRGLTDRVAMIERWLELRG